MILLISQNYSEHSTDEIIDWLAYNQISFIRLNGVDILKKINIRITEKGTKIEIPGLDLDKVSTIWYRRWITPENRKELLLKMDYDDINPVALQLNEYLRGEYKTLTSFFLDTFDQKKIYSSIRKEELNKLSVLKKAVELGIKVPNTYIVNSRAEHSGIKKTHLITKSISESPSINVKGNTYLGYTANCEKMPNSMTERFAPSLFQDAIDKKYEIRAFYLNKKIYSMAIFSQANAQTETDFRIYDYQNPNRVVPFKLPAYLEDKLVKLADHFKLKSGSFDLIKTKDNKYVFLEVNPGGQFAMVSKPCNYHLEREFAQELIKHNSYE